MTEQSKDYTTGCLLDYGSVKNHHRLIAAHLSRQKKLDANPQAIQQIQLVGQLKKLNANGNAIDKDADQNIFV